MKPKPTYEECKQAARQAKTKSVYRAKYRRYFEEAKHNGWYEEFFGAGRADDYARNCTAYTVTIPRPEMETFDEIHEWQMKNARKIQRYIKCNYKPPRPAIIVVEPSKTRKKGQQKFECELNMLRLTTAEGKEFDKIAENSLTIYNTES